VLSDARHALARKQQGRRLRKLVSYAQLAQPQDQAFWLRRRASQPFSPSGITVILFEIVLSSEVLIQQEITLYEQHA
jgi:hypothetical protein